jgi:hypothetical protein
MSAGSNPACKAMEKEVARVPSLNIGAGAQPGPNDGTKHINPIPTFPGGDRGRDPAEYAMKGEVNSVPKGNGGGRSSRASKGADFAAKRSAVRKKS